MITNKEKNFISAVLYVHNSESQLNGFLPKLYTALSDKFEKFEIICVNDGSTDDSKKVIAQISKDMILAAVSVIHMSAYQGIEASMNAGMDLAIGDFVYEFDTLSVDYDISLIGRIYDKALEGFDIVSAAPPPECCSSKLFYKVFNSYSLFKGNIIQHESFRILSRRAINRVKSQNKTLAYRKAVYASCGLKSNVIFYKNTIKPRKYDKEEKDSRIEIAVDSLILFTNSIQKLSLYISMVFLFLTVAIGIYTTVSYFGSHKPVEGWTPLMLFLALGFFGIFLMLTVTLQYLAVMLKIIFKKRQYLIESIDKITNN